MEPLVSPSPPDLSSVLLADIHLTDGIMDREHRGHRASLSQHRDDHFQYLVIVSGFVHATEVTTYGQSTPSRRSVYIIGSALFAKYMVHTILSNTVKKQAGLRYKWTKARLSCQLALNNRVSRAQTPTYGPRLPIDVATLVAA